MRWPWQRSRGRHTAIPAQRLGTWTQPALPPRVDAPRGSAAGTGPVRLGFSDGSELELAASDPSALALHALADVLVADHRRTA